MGSELYCPLILILRQSANFKGFLYREISMKPAVKNSNTAVKKKKNDASKDVDTKIKKLEQEIKSLNKQYDDAIATSTELFIQMGYKFCMLKKLLKENGTEEWEEFCDKKFPNIKEKKRQRCMKLSKSVDLKEHPDLKYIPITTLEILCNYKRDENIGKLLIEKAGFIDLKTLSDEPTSKAISEFKREIDDFVATCNGGWGTSEEPDPYNKMSSFKRQSVAKAKRAVASREAREIRKRGLIDFVQLETGVNRCLKMLNKHFNHFLYGGDKFYDRRTDKKGDYCPILILNREELKDFVQIFSKILNNNKVRVNDSEFDIDDYWNEFDNIIKKSSIFKDIENDL